MNIIDDLEREWTHLRYRNTSAATAAAAVTMTTSNPGGPVSTLSNDLHAIAAKLETIGDDGVEILQRVKANPETAKALTALDELTGLNVAPGLIDIVSSGLSSLVDRLKAAVPADPSFTPAGPTVAGQA